MDYGRELQFGFFLTPDATSYPEVTQLARLCDRLGLDLIGIQDHPYQRRFFDTWTLIAYLSAQTERVHFFPDVANLPLRPPAMLAKAAASLDILSAGRFELGLGAGAFWDGIRAMNGPSRTPGEAVAALEEAIQIIRLMWSAGRGLRYDGKYYELRGAHGGPAPTHPIGIWLGAYGPKMLDLTGQSAEGWVPSSSYAPPEKLNNMQARIDDAAAQAGRNPGDIQRLYNINGLITAEKSEGFLIGPASRWVDELTRLALDQGIDTFIFSPVESPAVQLDLFTSEVIPRVRENVAQGRLGKLITS
ncbi:MAG TPA: LLM class flavin-dependent oxidoreductase [Anaerolineaceae bacterium]|nr:LLM class flavin-dependent oxidoreductase [Anaerolineaceae bacterium]